MESDLEARMVKVSVGVPRLKSFEPLEEPSRDWNGPPLME